MKQTLQNIWNAQRSATRLSKLESKHEWLVTEYKHLDAKCDKWEATANEAADLAITLAVEYRAAIGNPTDMATIPVCIQAAHELRGRHTSWYFKADKDFGTLFANKEAKREMRLKNQYSAAGLGDWDGWKNK